MEKPRSSRNGDFRRLPRYPSHEIQTSLNPIVLGGGRCNGASPAGRRERGPLTLGCNLPTFTFEPVTLVGDGCLIVTQVVLQLHHLLSDDACVKPAYNKVKARALMEARVAMERIAGAEPAEGVDAGE